MSGSLTALYDHINYAVTLHNNAMAKLQEQAATGSRINRASDDPASAYRLLSLKTQDSLLQNYIDNVSDMIGSCEVTDTVLQSMASELLECKRLLTQVAGGIYSQSNRTLLANSINDHLEQLVLLANTKHASQYLFGGTKTDQAPFSIERDISGQVVSVSYNGSSTQRYIEVAPGITIPSFLVGNQAFTGDSRANPEFLLRTTGARPGSGTSSVSGVVWLTVTQDQDGHYNLSIDNGQTITDLGDASDLTNVPVLDSKGRVLYVDATGINSTGIEMVVIDGTFDIFQTLITIRGILKNERSLTDQQLAQILPKTIDWIGQVSDQIVKAETFIGSRMALLDNLSQTLKNMQANIQDESTMIENADISQIAIDLSKYQTLYQMSLAVAGKLLSVSLLDFID